MILAQTSGGSHRRDRENSEGLILAAESEPREESQRSFEIIYGALTELVNVVTKVEPNDDSGRDVFLNTAT